MDLSSVLQFGFVVGILGLVFPGLAISARASSESPSRGAQGLREGRSAVRRSGTGERSTRVARRQGTTSCCGSRIRSAFDSTTTTPANPSLCLAHRTDCAQIFQAIPACGRSTGGSAGKIGVVVARKMLVGSRLRRVIVHAVRRRHRSPDYAVRTCESCGAQISGRSDRRFCSTRCRVSAHRALRRSDARDWREAAAWLLEHGWPELWGESSARRGHDIVRAQVANSPMRATTGNSRLTGDRESTELPSRSARRPPLLPFETRGGNPTARQFLTGKCRIGGEGRCAGRDAIAGTGNETRV